MTKESPKKPKAKDTKTTHKKVFDVVPPGKSLALPNSRSVIMGHKRQARDDQFVSGSGSISSSSPSSGLGNPSDKHPLLDSHKKIDLKPGTDSGSASKEDASSGDVAAGLASTSPEATATAPVLPKTSAPPTTVAPTASKDETLDETFAEAPKSADDSDLGNAHGNASPYGTSDGPNGPQSDVGTSLNSDPSSLAGTAASTAPLVPSSANTADFGAHDNTTTSDLLADLAVEQVVDQPGSEPSSTKVDGSVSAGAASGGSSAGVRNGGAGGPNSVKGVSANDATPGATGDASQPKTVDDLLAETGAPDLSPQKAIVSTHHHRGRFFHIVLTFLLILIVGVIALNFLLDAGIIETELDLPYTDLIK